VEDTGGLSLIREAPAPYQALVAPSKVNFAALSFPAERIGTTVHAYEVLAAHILKVESLWEKIRMQGGAYGAFATVNATEGVFSMASYRDPHTHRTLNAFRESLSELAAGVDPGLLEKAIISVVGRELKPHAPGEEGMLALRRKLYGISDDLRQAKRELLLAATPTAVAAAAEGLLATMQNEGGAVLLGSDEALKDAAQVIPGFNENRLTLPL
jgi:Zn-dependent M16 (insulinase) family peptidase